jgi:hypothetical protein
VDPGQPGEFALFHPQEGAASSGFPAVRRPGQVVRERPAQSGLAGGLANAGCQLSSPRRNAVANLKAEVVELARADITAEPQLER